MVPRGSNAISTFWLTLSFLETVGGVRYVYVGKAWEAKADVSQKMLRLFGSDGTLHDRPAL